MHSILPPELKEILLLGLLNPAALLAGYWIGRHASQVQKVVVAAFAAGAAGLLFAWLLIGLGLTEAQPRLLPGILIVSGLSGAFWAWLGFRMRGSRAP